jgi:hypothetical protein
MNDDVKISKDGDMKLRTLDIISQFLNVYKIHMERKPTATPTTSLDKSITITLIKEA